MSDAANNHPADAAPSGAVHPVAKSELPQAWATLAASFDADPLFNFLLPEARRRRRWLELIMAAALHDSFPDGYVVAAPGGPGAGVMGVIPPGAYPAPGGRLGRFVWHRGARPPFPWPTWRLLRTGGGTLRIIDRLHPGEPHYYLQVIGVDPEHKGRGLGGALLRHLTAEADAAGMPVYLETANEANLGFYRRYGFDITHHLDTPGGGPPLWTMWRPVSPPAR